MINHYHCLITIWLNPACLRDTSLLNRGDFDFGLSRLVKIKCDSDIDLPTYDFHLMLTNGLTRCLCEIGPHVGKKKKKCDAATLKL